MPINQKVVIYFHLLDEFYDAPCYYPAPSRILLVYLISMQTHFSFAICILPELDRVQHSSQQAHLPTDH